jgi:pyruvate formate lyase activating enzyme
LSKTNPLIASQFATSDEFISPEKLLEIALKRKCKGTSISFNEPALLFEYSLEVFKLAKKLGMYNTYVTNGYMTEEVLRDLVDAGLDAMNVDIKGDSEMVQKYCGTDVEKVWRNVKLAKKLGVYVEITTLLIPELNTQTELIKKISERIYTELGDLTPFHISRFFPHYKSSNYGLSEPTPLKLLYDCRKIAKDIGLKNIYLGNLTTTEFNDSFCPNCSKLVIKRKIMGIEKLQLDKKGNCKFCGFPICII